MDVENLLPITATMGNEVECYGTKHCPGNCSSCPLYGQLAVVIVSNLFRIDNRKDD